MALSNQSVNLPVHATPVGYLMIWLAYHSD